MSEDRTLEPSKRRLAEARARGQVARSPELTGAAALLAASALLGVWGDDLMVALVGMVREPWSGDLGVGGDLAGMVARLRRSVLGVAGPLLGLLGGSVAAAVSAHQAQVGGLFAPSLIAPDPARFRIFRLGEEGGEGPGLVAGAGRGVWSLAKAAVVVAVAAWAIRSGLDDWPRLARLEPRALAMAAGAMARSTALKLAGATLVLGLVDFSLQYRRFEALMRMTPDQHREDLKAADGDPALRGRRLRQARALRGDAPELLAGASLAVTGPSGLIVVLAGGPPPRRVLIRSSAAGATGRRIVEAARKAKLPTIDAPELARGLALVRGNEVPPEWAAGLAAEWPTT